MVSWRTKATSPDGSTDPSGEVALEDRQKAEWGGRQALP